MAVLLIIDDDIVSREVLGEMLSSLGHTVVHASRAAEGMAIVRERRLDMVFLDIFLPGKLGMEAIVDIHALAPGLKVVAISAGSTFSAFESLKWAEQRGAVGSLAKPFDRVELVALLNKTLGT